MYNCYYIFFKVFKTISLLTYKFQKLFFKKFFFFKKYSRLRKKFFLKKKIQIRYRARFFKKKSCKTSIFFKQKTYKLLSVVKKNTLSLHFYFFLIIFL